MTATLNRNYLAYGDLPRKPPLSLFKVERTNAGMSHTKLADELNVSRVTLMRTEQGTLVSPNKEYVKWLVDNRGYSFRKLNDVYRQFQERTRKYNGKITPENQGGVAYLDWRAFIAFKNTSSRPIYHPLIRLCAYTNLDSGNKEVRSIASFIKAFCLPYSEVQRWGTYPNNVKNVPSSVISGLKDAGYDDSELQHLIDFYKAYRKSRGYS